MNYEQSKIYKIVCNITNEIYIGSTTKHYISDRLANHRSHYKKFKEGTKGYMTSFKILERGDYSIILIEKFPCTTREELIARERFYIESTICINKRIEGRTKKEWYEQTKPERLKTIKNYHDEHKEEIKEWKKNWYHENKGEINNKRKEKHQCEVCGSSYSFGNLTRHIKTEKHKKMII